MRTPFDLSDQDRKLIGLFVLGVVLGLVVISLIESWVIETDLADRRRIREELGRWLANLAEHGDQGKDQELTELRFAVNVYKGKLAELDRGYLDDTFGYY
jgi:hypothetical protein